MRKFKKAAVVMMTALTMASSVVCAWGAEAKTAYTFTSNEVQVSVGEKAAPVLKALGKEKEVKTLTNCANGGKDKVYVYDGFDIYTTQDEKKTTIIQSVVLTDDKTATEEGVKLGQTPKDVMKAYPDAKEDMGLYTVDLGNSRIVIDCGLKNDKVVDISYEYYESEK